MVASIWKLVARYPGHLEVGGVWSGDRSVGAGWWLGGLGDPALVSVLERWLRAGARVRILGLDGGAVIALREEARSTAEG